ncbi:hypothetical protein BGX38DRAFT_1277660 [Terfezia claveryi]|nr:hypothetical protein BGX38DRAFT_1277660 [Terfezia claveryi]
MYAATDVTEAITEDVTEAVTEDVTEAVMEVMSRNLKLNDKPRHMFCKIVSQRLS